MQKISDMKNLIGLLNKMIFLIYLRYFKNLANGLREFVNPHAREVSHLMSTSPHSSNLSSQTPKKFSPITSNGYFLDLSNFQIPNQKKPIGL